MANAVCHELGLNADDVYLAVAPMYAAASMGYLYATLLSGGTVGIVPAFIPDQVFRYVENVQGHVDVHGPDHVRLDTQPAG